MKYGSVCSGIEAATVAWHDLGLEPAFFSEIEKFPRKVLQHHYPNVPLHGDFTTIEANQYGPVDLLVGGTPCQSFSIAGLRAGLNDERGNLCLEYVRLVDRLRPRWVVWENVPGVLSSGGGRDFGTFLGALADIGYGFAYRVLDAQFFGVPQRRRRVFVVGYYGDPSPAGAVLLDTEGLLGHPPESEAAAERAANGAAYCSENHRIVGALDTECGLNKQTHQSLVNGHFALGTLTTRSLVALGARDVEDGYVIPAPGRRVRKLTPTGVSGFRFS